MASHFRGPLLGANSTWADAGENLSIEGIAGEGDLVTTFEDFNRNVPADTFGNATSHFEDIGWVLTDAGAPAADRVQVYGTDIGATGAFTFPGGVLELYPGTTADTGGSAFFDGNTAAATAGTNYWSFHNFQSITGSGTNPTAFDNTTFVVGMRVGLVSSVSGSWDGKCFAGHHCAFNRGIMTPATGDLPGGANYNHVGIHVAESGDISGTAQGNTAVDSTLLVAGTDWTGDLVADTPIWFDFAYRLDITDWSAYEGTTQFYYRRVTQRTNPGEGAPEKSTQVAGPWVKAGSIADQIPSNAAAAVVPAFEAIHGGGANECAMLVDWFTCGRSRFSRTGKITGAAY